MIDPAYFWVPPRLGSYGDEAIDLAAEAGWDLDDEQKLAVDAFLSYGPGGRWAQLESVIIEPRQNGKTTRVLQPVTLFDLFLLPPDRIVWTAHLFRTSRDSFNDFHAAIKRTPMLSRRVKKVSESHGEEYIELHNGARMEFLARSSGGGRGLGGKRVVLDEALILDAGAMGALLPTLSARPDAQVNYGSSAGKETSTQLHALKKRGRAGGDPSLVYAEWCAPGSWEKPPCDLGKRCPHTVTTKGCALDNEEFWKQSNHAVRLGRITVEYLRNERRAFAGAVREYGRERLGWHENVIEDGNAIDMKLWGDLKDPESVALDPVSVAFEVANDRSTSAIAIAGRREDGLIHLQVIKSAPGVSWVVDDVVELSELWGPCAIVVDDKSGAASLLPDLKERGLKVRPRDPERLPLHDEIVVTTWATDMARACGQLYDSIAERHNVRHLGQAELDESMRGAVWRTLSDAKAWSRKDALSDPSPLIAVTLALHGLLIYGPELETNEVEGALMA